MSDVEIKMNSEDMDELNKVYAYRVHRWQGRRDIHGYYNNPISHAVGLWGELGVLKWLQSNELEVIWAREDDSVPDFMICRKFGIETKAQQPHNWPEYASTVQQKSYKNWLEKESVCYVVWTVCPDPLKEGVSPVLIKGWNTIQEIGSSKLQKIRKTCQYKTYPNIRQPNQLIDFLKKCCSN